MTIESIEKADANALNHVQGGRVERLDVYRGCAMVLVVLGHSIQAWVPDFDHNWLFKAIYLFHMPLFFYISGMVAGLTRREGLQGSFSLIRKRAINLLLPFFAWYCVGFFIQNTNKTFLECLKLLYLSVDNGLWFLWVLFFCSVLAELAKYLTWKMRLPAYLICIGIVIAVMIVNTKVHVLGAALLLIHLPFFFAGMYHRDWIGYFEKKKRVFTVLALMIFPCLVLIWQRNELYHLDVILQGYGLPTNALLHIVYIFFGLVLNSLCAVVGIVLFFQVVGFIFSFRKDFILSWAATFAFIGRRTMEIYAMQFYFIGAASNSKSQALEFLFSTICAIALSIVVSEFFIKPIPIASLLLLGRRQKVSSP